MSKKGKRKSKHRRSKTESDYTWGKRAMKKILHVRGIKGILRGGRWR